MKADVLSDVLRAVRLTGAVYFDNEMSSPRVAAMPPSREIAGVEQHTPGRRERTVASLRADVRRDDPPLSRDASPAQTGWLAGLRDPVVGQALAALHGEPRRGWTVEGLARAVGLSRSVLAERFAEMVGQPPIRSGMTLAAVVAHEQDRSCWVC
jgi:hypothetical protein